MADNLYLVFLLDKFRFLIFLLDKFRILEHPFNSVPVQCRSAVFYFPGNPLTDILPG